MEHYKQHFNLFEHILRIHSTSPNNRLQPMELTVPRDIREAASRSRTSELFVTYYCYCQFWSSCKCQSHAYFWLNSPSTELNGQYLEVGFPEPVTIFGLNMNSVSSNYLTAFQFQLSVSDNQSYTTYSLNGNIMTLTDSAHQRILFTSVLTARYIRLVPLSYSG